MSFFFRVYTFIWIAACSVAIFLYTRDKNHFALSRKSYWVFLSKPWKIITFIIAATLLIFVSPYSGDYTWDYYDTSFMSISTFLTAPWAIGVFYRFRKGKASFKQTFVAFCLWMFSVSWSYDIYIFYRDKEYPHTWWPNIVLSSILYACAGLLWSLDWKKEKGIFMSFKEDTWPTVSQGRVFHKIFIATLPYILIAAILAGWVIYKLNFPR